VSPVPNFFDKNSLLDELNVRKMKLNVKGKNWEKTTGEKTTEINQEMFI